ncbi:MAG: hypothetical protein M3O90_08960 [Actinomycetota bacterium]|nr:hypothetical protein [Actinomycetota bacterium]
MESTDCPKRRLGTPYKGEPIPGGPSDPDAPPDPAMVGEEDDEMGEDDDKDSSESGSGSDS